MKKLTHKLAAAATMGVLAASDSDAFAATVTFSDVSTNIVNASSGLTQMISTLSYIGGAGLGVAGIFKLKNHVDNPGQVPMKDGLVRLGAGGGLLSLPFVVAAMQGNIGAGNTTKVDASLLKLDNAATVVAPTG